MMHSARAFGATPLNVGNVRTNYREIAPVVVAAALHHPQRGQVLQSFDGVMIEYGWRIMFQSDKPVNCKLTFKVHEDGVERIDIRGGVSDNIKKAKNLFAIHELNRVVYYSTEQISGERQPPAQAYTLYFDFRDKKLERLEFKFTKQVLDNLIVKLQDSRSQLLANGVSEPDMGIFVI
mmetsp:Transcript_19922/g.26892  ORF Transcript_19922/g.26892 Transcript_19922/m.26892 type:complete len:178 (+) Transcript_19922:161-694(+)